MNMNLEELQQKLITLENEYEKYNIAATELRNSFKAFFPAKKCPLFLYRDSKAKAPLYWRYSSIVPNKLGNRVSDGFWQLIKKSVPIEDRTKLYEFEANRLSLNYKLSTTAYDVSRLRILVIGIRKWEEGLRESIHHEY